MNFRAFYVNIKKMEQSYKPLILDNVTKIYSENSISEFKALSGVSFCIEKKGVYGLIGPNGAGKTTLLRIISNVIKPTSGIVSVCGFNPIEDPIAAKKKIGFLSVSTGLYERITPRETLSYFGTLFDLERSQLDSRIDELVELLEMQDFVDKKNEILSLGQKQRVNIARCLIHNPEIFVFDEITEGLDVLTSRIIIKFIKFLESAGKTVILSTHDMHMAEKLCHNIIMLYNGSIIESGRLYDLKIRYNSKFRHLDELFLEILKVNGHLSRHETLTEEVRRDYGENVNCENKL